MSGVRMSATKALIRAPNSVPMTTAMARSTTLPRMMSVLKPLSTFAPFSRAPRQRRVRSLTLGRGGAFVVGRGVPLEERLQAAEIVGQVAAAVTVRREEEVDQALHDHRDRDDRVREAYRRARPALVQRQFPLDRVEVDAAGHRAPHEAVGLIGHQDLVGPAPAGEEAPVVPPEAGTDGGGAETVDPFAGAAFAAPLADARDVGHDRPHGCGWRGDLDAGRTGVAHAVTLPRTGGGGHRHERLRGRRPAPG